MKWLDYAPDFCTKNAITDQWVKFGSDFLDFAHEQAAPKRTSQLPPVSLRLYCFETFVVRCLMYLRRPLLGMLITVFLVGCSSNLTITGRDNGQRGDGVSTGWNGSGTLIVNLNSKTYVGGWVMAGSSLSATGSATGTALLNSEDGSRLRCEFTFSYPVGFGTCEDDKNKIYDVQIH